MTSLLGTTTQLGTDGLMRLGMLSFMFRRIWVPIEARDVAVLNSEGARAFIHATAKGMQRARARIWSILASAALLWLGMTQLNWSGPDLMAILLAMSATTTFLDGLRLVLAGPWAIHSETREFRVDELLGLARSIERGQPRRLSLGSPLSKRQPVIAGACTIIGLPLLWHAMALGDWVSWNAAGFGSYVLSLIIALSVLRIGYEIYRIKSVKLFPAGHFDLFLEAEDVLDNYILLSILIIVTIPLGSTIMLVLPFLVFALRLIYQSYRYLDKWRSLRSLGRRLRGMTPA